MAGLLIEVSRDTNRHRNSGTASTLSSRHHCADGTTLAQVSEPVCALANIAGAGARTPGVRSPTKPDRRYSEREDRPEI